MRSRSRASGLRSCCGPECRAPVKPNQTESNQMDGELDLRLAWRPIPKLEFAIVGQNLVQDHHAEFGALAGRQEIERSVYGKITYWW